MPELGDYVRLIRRINNSYESVSVGEVFEVIDVMSPFPNLAGVYINGYRRWLTTTEYELMTPFEVAVYRRLKETTMLPD